MDTVHLDCSGLRDIRLRIDGHSFSLDGSDFIQQLRQVLDEFQVVQQDNLRDMFAAKAMQAHTSTYGLYPNEEEILKIAIESYKLAEAMLKARDMK